MPPGAAMHWVKEGIYGKRRGWILRRNRLDKSWYSVYSFFLHVIGGLSSPVGKARGAASFSSPDSSKSYVFQYISYNVMFSKLLRTKQSSFLFFLGQDCCQRENLKGCFVLWEAASSSFNFMTSFYMKWQKRMLFRYLCVHCPFCRSRDGGVRRTGPLPCAVYLDPL